MKLEPAALTNWRRLRKLVIFIVGGSVLGVGVVMLVAPGPAFLVIPAGLAILATEFAWARRWLHQARDYIRRRTHRGASPPGA